ncbi:MAG: hypothetical protein IKL55_03220 [Clostridia bacterium]|nr:hypothetical protein [Clostridia bacterium]
MNFDKKILIDKKVIDAWQFIEVTCENLRFANTSAELIKNYYDKLNVYKNEFFEQKLSNSLNRTIAITAEDEIFMPINILGVKYDSGWMIKKWVRDFFQYAMSFFDSLGQVINSCFCLNMEGQYFFNIVEKIVKEHKKGNYINTGNVLNCISNHKTFLYVKSFNDRSKHIKSPDVDFKWNIISDEFEGNIDEFSQKGQKYDEIADFIKETTDIYSFLEKLYLDLEDAIMNDLQVMSPIENRIDQVCAYIQCTKDIRSRGGVFYIEVENDITELAEEIEVILCDKVNLKYQNVMNDVLLVQNKKGMWLGKYEIENIQDLESDIKKYIKFKRVSTDGEKDFGEEFIREKKLKVVSGLIKITFLKENDKI